MAKIDYGNQPIIVNVRGIKQLQNYLKTVPKEAGQIALKAAATYIIGNDQRGLKHEPPRRTHGPGNPYKWQTERQRRAFFATKGFGRGIPSKRRRKPNRMVDGWKVVPKMDYWQVQLVNKKKEADFIQGVIQQRGHWADGWRKARDIVRTNVQGAIKAAQVAVDKFVKSKK